MRAPQIAIGTLLALGLAGGGFAAGITYEKSQAQTVTPSDATGATGAAGRGGGVGRQIPGQGGVTGGQLPVTGRILAVNEGSITVAAIDRTQGQPQAGASPTTTTQIVLVGSSTRLVKTIETEVKLADLKVDDQITAVGTTDSAGLLSATTIVVGPTNLLGQLLGSQTGTGGLGGGGARPSAAPSRAP